MTDPEGVFGPHYDVVLADFPWSHFGDPNKMGAAGKHYAFMSDDEVFQFPMRSLLQDPKRGAFFIWATCPRLNMAIRSIEAWGLVYRGVAFNWVKTRKDGKVIGAQGIPPTGTKPTSELCLLATVQKTGRPFKLLDAGVPQVVLAPRGRHSEKPPEVRDRIVRLYGERPRIELFARARVSGWAAWGLEAPPEVSVSLDNVPRTVT
jgi:N6-adenosine-specific RNA methylase IME4